MPKREKPAIIVRKTKRGIVPVSAFDEERLSVMPLDSEFDITPRKQRSHPQNRTYWLALSNAVAATGIAPTAWHLHGLLKMELGYFTLFKDFSGNLLAWPDSTSFDAMPHDEFTDYFLRAMTRLAEVTGTDPLAFLEEAKAA